MVESFSQADRDALDQAVTEAERRTRAELVVVVSPMSDGYENYFILHGLLLGSLIAFGLWETHVLTSFPYLLVVQMLSIALLFFVPPLHALGFLGIPSRVREMRVAQRASDEYYLVSRLSTPETPFVLLYVSLDERQTLFLSNPLVAAKIGCEKWNELMAGLVADARAEGLKNACLKAVRSAGDLLEKAFPEDGRPSTPIPNVRDGGVKSK